MKKIKLIRQWIGKKIAGDFYNHKDKITDEMRQKALEIKRQETALRQAEKQAEFMDRLLKLEYRVNPKKDAMENLIEQVLPILLTKIAGEKSLISDKSKVIDTEETQPQQTTAEVKFSDEQIKALVNANPKIRKYADKFSDDAIKEYVINQIPNISKESLEKVIIEVRS